MILQKIAGDLKIEFNAIPIGLSDDLPDFNIENTIDERKKYWLPRNEKYIHNYYLGEYEYPLFQTICNQLFLSLVVNTDGKIFPCCWMTDKKNIFGDLLSDSFEHIWNNDKYLNSRSLFLRKNFCPNVHTICFTCHNFKENPSLKDKIALFRLI